MAKFDNTDFKAMYAGFRAAMAECERVTGRTFRMQRDCSIWVSCAGYDFLDYSGVPARAKAVKEWKVPAARFWPGGKFPAILAPVKIVESPAVDWSGWQDFVKEHAAAADRLADKHATDSKAKEAKRAAEWKAGEPARRAKEERERQERVEYQARRVAQQQAQIAAKKAREAEKARLRKALRAPQVKPASALASEKTLGEIIAKTHFAAAEIVETQPVTMEKTMNELRKAADTTGRIIPANSTEVTGLGGAVYLYAVPYVTKKGREGSTLYAKAFRPGARRHEWHQVFATAEARLQAVQAFLKEEKVS